MQQRAPEEEPASEEWVGLLDAETVEPHKKAATHAVDERPVLALVVCGRSLELALPRTQTAAESAVGCNYCRSVLAAEAVVVEAACSLVAVELERRLEQFPKHEERFGTSTFRVAPEEASSKSFPYVAE